MGGTLVLVAARNCPVCVKATGMVERAAADLRRAGIDDVVVAYRRSDRGAQNALKPDASITVITIEDNLWWSLVRHEPPEFVIYEAGQGRIVDALRDVYEK